jgi:hypothetical protein
VCPDDRGRVACLGQTYDHALFFVYPVRDKVDPILLFDGEVFLMCVGYGCGGDLSGAKFMYIQEELFAGDEGGFGACGDLVNGIGQEAMCFTMCLADGFGIGGGGQAIYITTCFIDPEFNKRHSIFLLYSQVFGMGVGDGFVGYFSWSEVVNIYIIIYGIISHIGGIGLGKEAARKKCSEC